jgi:hypothetical protein
MILAAWEIGKLGFQGREKEEEQEKRRKKLLADQGRVCVGVCGWVCVCVFWVNVHINCNR